MLHHEKSETLLTIISSVGCLCQNSIHFKSLLFFSIPVCFPKNIEEHFDFYSKQIGISSAPFEFEKCYWDLCS